MRLLSILFAACLTLGALAGPAAADETLDPADRAAIQQIIRSQLDAFRRDDGDAAFGFASPMIHGIFKTSETFMNMVRQGYPPVYRSTSAAFAEITWVQGEPVQRVHIVGENGATVIAAYVMQKQPDGTWKINGVYLFKDDSQAT